MKELANAHITIIGMGLMGGSFAAALQGKCSHIIGMDRNLNSLVIAEERGWIDSSTTDLKVAVQETDILILATPVRAVLDFLDELGGLISQPCFLMDLGSTKTHIIQKMEHLPENIHSVGGHPMCGREVAGIDEAVPGLYNGNAFILVPHTNTSRETLDYANTIVRAVGAHPLILQAEEHDKIVSVISHLPYLIAGALVSTADQMASEESPLLWKVASSGFRDTSRLAASNLTMMVDILVTNQKAVLEGLVLYKSKLNRLEKMISDNNESELRATLAKIFERRRNLKL